MSLLNVVALLGGLALFLYGISLMGAGLDKVAGNKLEVLLYRLTSSSFKGILLGAAVTALIQSSSATSIMAIGFVNSGLMQFRQAVSIIMGSIIGTSVTGWIVSLSTLGGGGGWTDYVSNAFITGVLAIIGILLFKFSKKKSSKDIGSILLGFAVLMFGMTAMSDAVAPLKESAAFAQLLTKFSNPVLGVLVGTVFTAIIQSSAAAVGILQALSMTGALSFAAAFPIMLGIAIGGALPVLLSAIGASINARRTAFVHLVIDIAGALIVGIVFYATHAVFSYPFFRCVMTPVSVALLNTIFRVIVVAVLAPMIGLLEKLVCAIIKDDRQSDAKPETWDLLEERLITRPQLAIEQSRIVINSMASYVKDNLERAILLRTDFSKELYDEIQEQETIIDQYEDKLGNYLVKVSPNEMTKAQNEDMYQFLHAITDLERIGDHAVNLAETARDMRDGDISLGEEAKRELVVLQTAVLEIVDITFKAFMESDHELARRVEPLEELIDTLCDEMKSYHIDRLQKGICTLQNGYSFTEFLTDFERISDHCSHIALAMIELEQEQFELHNYVESLTKQRNAQFERCYEEYRRKYTLDQPA